MPGSATPSPIPLLFVPPAGAIFAATRRERVAGERIRAEEKHQDCHRGTNRVPTRVDGIRQNGGFRHYRAGCGRNNPAPSVGG